MCTLSYINYNNKIYFTSNRDEHINRQENTAPIVKKTNDLSLCYTPDPKTGGTWLVLNNKGTIAVLLNGADTAHIAKPPYKHSRGKIVLDIITDIRTAKIAMQQYDCNGLEPFTVVLYENELLTQFRWNGIHLSELSLDPTKNHIWSSSTLYGETATTTRRQLFEQFLEKEIIDTESILNFHCNGYNHPTDGFSMKRENGIATLSITQIAINEETIAINYKQLQTKTQHHITLPLALLNCNTL